MGYIVIGRDIDVDLVNAQGVVTQANVRVVSGKMLPENVSPFLLNALRASGVVAFVADRDTNIGNPQVRELELEPPAQVRTQDHPPILPSDPVGNRIVTGEESPEEAAPVTAELPAGGNLDPKDTVVMAGPVAGDTRASGQPAEKPPASATKDVWEDYAVSRGMDRGQAESMSKKELLAEVERREKS